MPRQKKQYKHLNQVRYQGTPIANNTTPETANIVEISELPIDTNAVSENDNAINIAELSESNVLSERPIQLMSLNQILRQKRILSKFLNRQRTLMPYQKKIM